MAAAEFQLRPFGRGWGRVGPSVGGGPYPPAARGPLMTVIPLPACAWHAHLPLMVLSHKAGSKGDPCVGFGSGQA